MNTLRDIETFLKDNPGYLKWGKAKLAYKFGVSTKDIQKIKANVNTELQEQVSFKIADGEPGKKFKRLFFDIETSPNIGWFWRTSFKAKIMPHQILEERKVICVSWKWEGEDKVHHLFWDKEKSDKGLLKEFSKVMYEADECIAHNSDRFDIPWLRTRCLFWGIPFPTYIKSLDTLRKVKSMFNFQSNRLDYIANFLGFGHKIDISPDVWSTIVHTPTNTDVYKEAKDEMLEYCDYDVVLLEDVYQAIQTYIKPNTHVGQHNGNGKCSCPNCGSTDVSFKKNQFTASGTIKRVLECNECSSDYVVSNRAYKKLLKDKK